MEKSQIENAASAFGLAKWVWSHTEGRRYNDWAQFRLFFEWDGSSPVQLALTADCRYRLFVNAQWAGDGPVRGWPERYYYDLRDIAGDLRFGENEIRVWVQHYGGSSFHLIPQKGGFQSALWIDGKLASHTGDDRWQVGEVPERPAEAPRISVQMPPFEIVDAGRRGKPVWRAPVVLPMPQPWSIERLRDVVEPRVGALPVVKVPVCRRLAPTPVVASVPIQKLLHPGRVREVVQRSHACALAVVAEVTAPGRFCWQAEEWDIYINGEKLKTPEWHAEAGQHRVLAVYRHLFDNRVDASFGFPEGLSWRHPLPASDGKENSWVFLPLPDFAVDAGDLHWVDHRAKDLEVLTERYATHRGELGRATGSEADFAQLVQTQGSDLLPEPLFFPDPTAEFQLRRAVDEHPLRIDGDATVHFDLPKDGSEVELAFDLGDQKCGFIAFALEAPAGTTIDGHLVEHVRADGVIQHTHHNRNGFRYIAAGEGGQESFFSIQRRSGRHLFLRVHGAAGPVVLRGLTIHESSYPADCPHPFRCSDELLTRIWKAADRTMQLSMDDVYIDSLYEQTLWVGDARNEQLYGLAAYDARDISLRSIRLAADSLERTPMINSQVPSCWETIIPIWSFLWGMSVWEYFEHTGDVDTLRSLWPAVRKNLHAAAAQLNEDALFEAPWWNLFEWAHVDSAHRIVLHNTLFFVGAAEAALRCEAVVGDPDERDWLETLVSRLKSGVRRLRDPETGLYPESIHRDGTISRKFSIHTQFLSVLFGVAEGNAADHLLERVANNDSELVELASPFALQFYCEAFERRGRTDHVLDVMRRCFAPMVEIGTTLWEALPGSATSPDGFPTRSHCHGWSSGAMDLLPRIVLGLDFEEPGSRAFVCSPRPHGLKWAEGCRMSPDGPIVVNWEINDGTCTVEVSHPTEVSVRFETNSALEAEGLKLVGKSNSE